MSRRRVIVVTIGVLLVFAAGAIFRGGQPDYPPCPPGWHYVNAPITATIRPCADTSTRRGCVAIKGDPAPHVQQFDLPSCNPADRK